MNGDIIGSNPAIAWLIITAFASSVAVFTSVEAVKKLFWSDPVNKPKRNIVIFIVFIVSVLYTALVYALNLFDGIEVLKAIPEWLSHLLFCVFVFFNAVGVNEGVKKIGVEL